MRKKSVNNKTFDKKYLLGIEEDLSVSHEELEELQKLLEMFDEEHPGGVCSEESEERKKCI